MLKEKMATTKKQTPMPPLFANDNYIFMIIGGVVIALGMFLLSGGKNQDPKVFDYNVVYSTTRITVAPILIIVGLLIEVFAIFKKSKTAA
jgi:heme/copper-type cytochrome/quinol oxidase subunit 2